MEKRKKDEKKEEISFKPITTSKKNA